MGFASAPLGLGWSPPPCQASRTPSQASSPCISPWRQHPRGPVPGRGSEAQPHQRSPLACCPTDPPGPQRSQNPRSESKDCRLSPTTLHCGIRGCIKSVSGCSQGARGTRPGVDPDTFPLPSGNIHPKLRQTRHWRSGMFSESRHGPRSRAFHPSTRMPRIILTPARRSFRPLAQDSHPSAPQKTGP